MAFLVGLAIGLLVGGAGVGFLAYNYGRKAASSVRTT
jgi:hypothetical protein